MRRPTRVAKVRLPSQRGSIRRALASLALIGMFATVIPVAPANAAPASRTVVVQEGRRSTITGQLPAAYGGRLAVLELIDGRRRQELGAAVAAPSGAVRLNVAIGGAGTYRAHWRVLENGRTRWTSPTFALEVKEGSLAKRVTARAAKISAHARGFTTSSRSGLSPRLAPLDDSAGSSSGDSASAGEKAAKTVGSTMRDFGKSLATNIGWDLVADGTTALFNVAYNTATGGGSGGGGNQQIQQLSQQMQSDFSTIESQLDSIQTSLNSVQQQLATMQNDIVQTNASATASTCATLLGQANTYVTDIQAVYGNYQTVTDAQWVTSNLLGQSPQTGMNLIGSTLFGAGAGVPSFAAGLAQLQSDVNSLGTALGVTNGSPLGLMSTCASAIAANLAAQYSADQSRKGLTQTQSIVPVGDVDEAYFTQMQSLASYYSAWLAIGQQLASRGGQIGLAVLEGASITSAAQLNGLCSSIAAAPSSVLSCAGIAYNNQQSTGVYDAVWQLAGASWSEVTNGLLASDTKAGTASDYLVPAQNLWVQDISKYGMALPLATSASTGSYTPTGPLSSLAAASSSTPASAAAGQSLAFDNWLGMSFSGATTATWQSLIPSASAPAIVAAQPAGALLYQAGLANDSKSPTNLLIYTGEWSSFAAAEETNWFDAPVMSNPNSSNSFDVSGSQSFPPPGTTQALAFIDTNLQIQPGYNLVVQPPSGAAGTAMSLGTVMDGANSGPMSYTPCVPTGAVGTTCTGSQSFTGTLAMPAGVTQNKGFYSSYSATVSMGWSAKYAFGTETIDVSLSNFEYTVNSFNSMMGYGAGQTQYMWPISHLTASGQPSGSSCAMTSFTQGTNGNVGATNVCANMYADWMAGAVGVDTGPVSISSGAYQGTLTAAGNNVLQALVTNTSGSAQTVTIYADGGSGAQVGTVMTSLATAGLGALTGIGCTTPTAGVLECTAVVPPGTSSLSIPLLASNGSVNLGLGNATSASSSTTTVTATASGTSALPGAVTSLSATSAGVGGNSVTAQWTVPASSPAITGYDVTLTSPSGAVTSLSTATSPAITVVNGATTGATASTTIPLPSSQSGIWTVSVAAVNPGGTGPQTSVEAALGNSVPATPTGLQATMNDDGTVALTWNPVSAIPSLSNYSIAITPPSGASVAGQATPGQTTTVVSGVPAYTLQSLPAAGQYTFALTAVNALGVSAPATTTLNVPAMVPTQPAAIQASVDLNGWVNVAWMSSDSVPSADSYFVALYAPGSTAATLPVASMQVSAPVKTSLVQVLGLYRITRASRAGEWFVVVTPTNAVGVGEFGVTQFVMSAAAVANLSQAVALVGERASASSVLLARARAACTAGQFTIGVNVFGTCVNGVFTPATPAA